jgi:hypothetical protein
MDSNIFQAIKQACSTYYQRGRHPSKATSQAASSFFHSVINVIHCRTMVDIVPSSPIGSMHNGLSCLTYKTANKRLPLAEETSLLPGYTPSHQKYSSQEVTR